MTEGGVQPPGLTKQATLTTILKPEQRTNVNSNVDKYEDLFASVSSNAKSFPELFTFPEDDIIVESVEKVSRFAEPSVNVSMNVSLFFLFF